MGYLGRPELVLDLPELVFGRALWTRERRLHARRAEVFGADHLAGRGVGHGPRAREAQVANRRHGVADAKERPGFTVPVGATDLRLDADEGSDVRFDPGRCVPTRTTRETQEQPCKANPFSSAWCLDDHHFRVRGVSTMMTTRRTRRTHQPTHREGVSRLLHEMCFFLHQGLAHVMSKLLSETSSAIAKLSD